MKIYKYLAVVLVLIFLVNCKKQTQLTEPEENHSVTFTKSTQLFPHSETHQIELGDLDGDGDLDAVFANMGNNYSMILYNDGAGLFTDSGQQLTQQGHGVDIGDLDNDGDLDLFITCASYMVNNLFHEKPSRIYLNDGEGQFQDSGQDIGDTNLSGNGITLLDIDSDNDLDAHIYYFDANQFNYFHKIYLNNGNGLFQESNIVLPVGTEISWGDLDGDGDLDLFSQKWDVGYRVMMNNGSGNFTEEWQFSDNTVKQGNAVLGDFDGDGDLDIIVANGDQSAMDSTRIFVNDGLGQLTDSGFKLNPTKMSTILLGDLDLDGRIDAFVNNIFLPNQVWINYEDYNLTDIGLRLGGNEPSSKSALGDLDGDSDLDVFIAYFGNGSNSIWFNNWY